MNNPAFFPAFSAGIYSEFLSKQQNLFCSFSTLSIASAP
jgi:hypothetical protein